MIRTDGSIARRRRAGTRRSLETTFHYEIVNLTSYDNTGFPVVEDATLSNLRIIHRYEDGSTSEIPLHDASGLRQVDLDPDSVYLMSEELRLPEVHDRMDVIVSGSLRSDRSVGELVEGSSASSQRPFADFVLETIFVPGLYETLHVADIHGRRYAIGTLGMVIDDPSLDWNVFAFPKRISEGLRVGVGVGSLRHRLRA